MSSCADAVTLAVGELVIAQVTHVCKLAAAAALQRHVLSPAQL